MSCRNAEEQAQQTQLCPDAAEPTSEQVDRERERAHLVLRRIFNNEDGPWQCALKDRAHDDDCDIVATALARARAEK